MLKKFLLLSFIFLFPIASFASTIEDRLSKENEIQARINKIGVNLLNCNRINKRIIFTYDEAYKEKILDNLDTLNKRQVIVYGNYYKSASNDDELAAILAREISQAVKSYDGMWGGRIDSIQVLLGAKKFETVADKRAVDYMVNAGYDPIALITYINKTCPQKRSDRFARSNLTSKRLARIYEYITYKYPSYLTNSIYLENEYYQNFLLSSIENRRKLEEKIRNRSVQELKYE